jgi:hypothetical protein
MPAWKPDDSVGDSGTPDPTIHTSREGPQWPLRRGPNPQSPSGLGREKDVAAKRTLPSARCQPDLALKNWPRCRHFANGETRTRTGDTTIFRQLYADSEPARIACVQADSEGPGRPGRSPQIAWICPARRATSARSWPNQSRADARSSMYALGCRDRSHRRGCRSSGSVSRRQLGGIVVSARRNTSPASWGRRA